MAESKHKKILQTIQEKDGEYSYTGSHYWIAGSEPQRRRKMTVLSAQVLVLVALVIGAGCIDGAGASSAFYVILPYIGEVAGLFFLCWNFAKLFGHKGKLREYVLEHVRSRVPGAAYVMAVFAGLGLILSLVWLLRNGDGQPAAGYLYPVLKGLVLLLGIRFARDFRKAGWERCD